MNTSAISQDDHDNAAATAANAEGLTRRALLVRAAAGGGLMVGSVLPGLGGAQAQSAPAAANLTAWITIGSDETVTLQVPITEMGQGTMTGLAQVMADASICGLGQAAPNPLRSALRYFPQEFA